jgi:oligo-alginate lyase
MRARTPWGARIAERLLEVCAVTTWDVPEHPGGWMHDFQCQTHHDFLVYDPEQPHSHWCRAGHRVHGASVDAAWRVLRHRELADRAADAALLGRVLARHDLTERSALTLLEYARRYAQFAADETAQSWMLKGRAFQQALTEALWLTSIARAALLVRDALTPEAWNTIENHLLRPALNTVQHAQIELVTGQGKANSNFNAWLLASIVSSALALRDDSVLQTALEGPLSLSHHLERSVLRDGFSWEGSPYYHNFVALAYGQTFELLELAGVHAYDRWGNTLNAVWDVLPGVTWDNGDLMQRRDGAYWQSGPLRLEYAQTLEIALARTGDGRFAHILGQLTKAETRPWTALAYGTELSHPSPDPPRSRVFADSGFAVLRNDSYTATLEFGSHGGAHGHFDKLSLHFSAHDFPWAHDPGSPPYGSGVHRAFHQTTAAHNTIVMDGGKQASAVGRWLEGSEDRAVICADNAYFGTRLRRSVHLLPDVLEDLVEVESDDVHTFDWLFHAQGSLDDDDTQPLGQPLSHDGMYAHIQLSSRRAVPSGRWQTTFRTQGQTLTLNGVSDQPVELLHCRSPNTDVAPWLTRPLLIVRTQARQWRLETRFRAALID